MRGHCHLRGHPGLSGDIALVREYRRCEGAPGLKAVPQPVGSPRPGRAGTRVVRLPRWGPAEPRDPLRPRSQRCLLGPNVFALLHKRHQKTTQKELWDCGTGAHRLMSAGHNVCHRAVYSALWSCVSRPLGTFCASSRHHFCKRGVCGLKTFPSGGLRPGFAWGKCLAPEPPQQGAAEAGEVGAVGTWFLCHRASHV